MSEVRQEIDACVVSAFQLMTSAEGRDYTVAEIEDLLYELALASGLLSRLPEAQPALGRAMRRVMDRKLGSS